MPNSELQPWSDPTNPEIIYRLPAEVVATLNQMLERNKETALRLSHEHPEMYPLFHAIAQSVQAMTPEEVQKALTEGTIPDELHEAIEDAREVLAGPPASTQT